MKKKINISWNNQQLNKTRDSVNAPKNRTRTSKKLIDDFVNYIYDKENRMEEEKDWNQN